jgi:hypothetical protein
MKALSISSLTGGLVIASLLQALRLSASMQFAGRTDLRSWLALASPAFRAGADPGTRFFPS